ncbi:MAG: hypothetical protein JWN08_1003 [Frankiales bacterium]|nr:hypothetical protein [Frankiales bacterium]
MSEGVRAGSDARPAVLTGTSEGGGRVVPPAAATPEKLAARVDPALDRADRVLFTVTPRDELDGAARWQRLADEAWCGQLRHVVASTVRLSGSDRDFAGDELALALGLAPATGRALVWEYGSIAALPGLVEAVEVGRLTVRHVRAFMRAVDEVSLTLEQRQAVALIALARYRDQTPGEWADVVRRLVLTVDPQAAARRRTEKTAERKARFYPQPDEQGAMWLQAPVEQVARAEARLDAEARRLKAAGDERTTEQLVCDLALALLADGTLAGQPVPAFEVHVVVPLATLEGGDLEVAELPGWGPVLPSTARELAEQAEAFTQVAVDASGHVIAVGDRVRSQTLTRLGTRDDHRRPPQTDRSQTDRSQPDRFLRHAAAAARRPPVARDLSSRGYRPGTRLARHLQARDRTCVFPGCRRRAQRTDLDHLDPWPRGRTTADNLQCRCRHHHRAKHAVFTVLLDPDGGTVWISRSGWALRRRPQGY